MAKIKKILYNGLYILPETVTDAVLDNNMERTLTEMLDDKLSSTTEDTAEKKITFNEGLRANGDGVTATKVTANKGDIKQVTADKVTTEIIESVDYNGGLSGYKLGNVGADSYLEVDKLSVRKKAIFTELDIKRIDHIGGANVTSPASCRIAKVEPYYPSTTMTTAEGEVLSASDGDYNVLAATPIGYKCYFHAEQDGEQINNDWQVGDQALCHAYNLATPRYYWRLVVDKSTAIEDGYHWVALSITDCDTDSDEPMADDTIVCFGNRTDTDRQAVILMNSEGVTSPCLQQLKGINSYVIADANIVTQLSPTKNIIRGEQIELSTSSGDYKGVEQFANEALASAKGYTDTKATDAKTYADGVLSSAKTYADSVGTSTLGSAKTYADGKVSSAVNTAKNYIDSKASSTLADAKSYTNTQAADAKTYADGLFADADESLKTTASALESKITINAEGIAARATSEYVEQVKGEVNGQLTTLGTRIETTENSIEVKADKTELKAQKETIDALTTSLNNTITRVSNSESKITQNANQIATKVSQTELTQGLTDANFLAMAISKGKLLYTDPTFKEGKNGIDVYGGAAAVTITRKEIDSIPNDSGYGLEIITDTSAGSANPGAGGFSFYTNSAANKVYVTRIVAKIPSDRYIEFATNNTGAGGTRKWITSKQGTGDWQEYIYYLKCGSTSGSTAFGRTNYFYIKPAGDVTWQIAYATVYDATGFEQYTTLTEFNTEIKQLKDSIELRATKTDLQTVSNNVGAVENRLTTAESSLKVQADKISSVVSKQSAMVVDYDYSDFTTCGWLSGVWITNADGNNIGSPLGYEKDTPCLLLVIPNVKKGDVIRVVPNHKKDKSAVIEVVGSDGDAQGAEQDAYDHIGSDVSNYTWYGRSLTQCYSYDIEVGGSIEFAVPFDCPEFHVWLSDDWSDRSNVKVSHIKAKMSAQSRIDQTADNIRLQVGEAGINLDTKVITLDASKTIVTGDLAVRTVKTYWDDAQTQLKSAFNGNGDGTIVYYYPTGKVMKEDTFVTDSDGNVIGMKTTYYKADGSVAWVISEGGLSMTLDDYWVPIAGGKEVAFTTDVGTMMSICVEYTADAMAHFTERSVFSKFVSNSVNYAKYNGKVTKGYKTSEAPTAVTLFAGVLVYSIELYKGGLLPTYIVTYEQVTTGENQVSLIMTKKFNMGGEVN